MELISEKKPPKLGSKQLLGLNGRYLQYIVVDENGNGNGNENRNGNGNGNGKE